MRRRESDLCCGTEHARNCLQMTLAPAKFSVSVVGRRRLRAGAARAETILCERRWAPAGGRRSDERTRFLFAKRDDDGSSERDVRERSTIK
jgi:hypothetical protein